MKQAGFRIAGALCALAFALSSATAAAQSYPTKPIRMVVPYPPGGTTDIVARPVAKGLQEALGQPVIVENRPGAGGNIGMDLVAKAAPDGHTIAVSSVATLAIGASLYSHLPYDVLKDLAPVTRIAAVPNVLVVHPSVPANSVRELIAYAKANPGKLQFGSAGNGTTVHLSGELFKSLAGVNMQHIPYKGAAPAMIDLLGGRVQLMFDFLSSSLTQIEAKKLKALGVTGPKRSPLLPNVPTIAEAGVPGYEVYAAFGVLTTGGTPPAIVRKLNAEIVKLIATPGMKDILARQGADPIGDKPEEFARSLKQEVEKWAAVVKASGAKVD
jgi:tripartite-type tricarboxylate transporter receptor subunit TctC